MTNAQNVKVDTNCHKTKHFVFDVQGHAENAYSHRTMMFKLVKNVKNVKILFEELQLRTAAA